MRKFHEHEASEPGDGGSAFSYLASSDDELSQHPVFREAVSRRAVRVLTEHQLWCTWSAVHARARATGLPRGVRPLLQDVVAVGVDARPLVRVELALCQNVPLATALAHVPLAGAQARFMERVLEYVERGPAHALAVWRAALGGPQRWAAVEAAVHSAAARDNLPAAAFERIFAETALARTDQLQTVLLRLMQTLGSGSPTFWLEVLGTARAVLVARRELLDAARAELLTPNVTG